jgi:hypothetical protein
LTCRSDKGPTGDSLVGVAQCWMGKHTKPNCAVTRIRTSSPRLRDPTLLNAFAALADDLRMVLKASRRGESCGQEAANSPRLR